MHDHAVYGSHPTGFQRSRQPNRLVQASAGHAFTGLRIACRGTYRPVDQVIHIGIREWSSGLRLVPQAEHVVGHGITAYGHIPVVGLVRVVQNRAHTIDLCGHHILRPIGHKSGNGVGGRFERIKIEIRQREQIGVRAEHTLDNGLIAIIRTGKRKVLGDEEAQRLAWAEYHRTQENLESDIRVILQQV